MTSTRPGRGRPNRRQFLRSAAATGVAAQTLLLGGRRAAASGGDAVVEARRVISHNADLYHGWPTLAREPDGRLLLVWSGGREAHVCPFGRVEWMTSDDGGASWSWPRVLHDGPIDDRDAGITVTSEGSLLATTFTSLAYVPQLEKLRREQPDSEARGRWDAAHRRLADGQHEAMLGTWMLRSTDHGRSWSAAYRVPLNSPHGPVPLGDGRLLYAGKALWKDNPVVGVSFSEDDGQSWSDPVEIPPREGDRPTDYHELHAVEAADGRLIVQIRNHNSANHRETLQTESDDGGRTWTAPHAIGVWGLPSHLLRLDDERLLMTYGHRRDPLGVQARISDDHGASWSEPLIVSDDGTSGDLGYPSTVELDDGRLVTVWYERLAGNPNAVLRQATWRLG